MEVSASGGNNIEFIEFAVPTSGNYTIGVYQYGEKKGSRADNVAVSYYIK